MRITPSNAILGARVEGIDLSLPLSKRDFGSILEAMGKYGVLCFPRQSLDAHQLKAFSANFGRLQGSVTGAFCEPDVPEVMILSNIVEDGKSLGLADAGQDWHTDMSYNELIGFTNVLYAIKVPRRDGIALGNTMFANMHAAYADLSDELKRRLEGKTATHDFTKFWEEMRKQPGSTRPPLTPEQLAKRPPAVHPVFMDHPITGKKVLYCNPGYVTKINGLRAKDSDRLLKELFEHQLQQKYQFSHNWSENDVLMWDHIGTLHSAIPDYTAHEHRLIKRCQVMADRILDPAFVREGLSQAAA